MKKTRQTTMNMDPWFYKEINGQVTKRGFRSLNKYVLSVLKKAEGYTEKSYAKRCEQETKKAEKEK